jgi:REP element-mobilizing transposase RayT
MLLYHFVFSTKNRKPYLQPQTQQTVFEYLGGTARGLGAVPIQIGGWIDHVHLLLKLKTTHCIADFMRELKANTSKHFNETSGTLAKFGWQDGYGVFTVSRSAKPRVIEYIQGQEEHHSREDYCTEYIRLLELHEVGYDPKYVFD